MHDFIDKDEIERKRREKAERLRGLVPNSATSEVEPPTQEPTQDVGNVTVSTEPEQRTTYQIRLKEADRDFIRNYAYTRSQQVGRQVTYQQVIDEALDALRKSIKFKILKKPSR